VTRTGKIAAVFLGLAELALAALALFWAGLSVMMFDAPGSTDDPRRWFAFVFAALMPLALLGGAIAAFVAAARGERRLLVRGAIAVPLIVFAINVVALAIQR
jgi:hypothetical protein